MIEQPLKILIVEDDEDDIFLIRDFIREGIQDPTPGIDHTSSYEDAVAKLEDSDYDICMCDYRLGAMDGIALIKNLRARNVKIPIIVLTGQGDQEVAVEAMKAGATDYLTKGKLSPETLSHAIRYSLKLHREASRRKQTEQMLKKSHQDLVRANNDLKESMAKLKSAQKQILQSEKLAGIGRLAAGVCHEILNPLNIISGHAQALLMERDGDTPLMDDLFSITEEIQRIEKIISGLLKFSRKGDVELTQTNINQELDSVLSIIEKEMSLEGIEVVREFCEELPSLYLDNDRIRQVFLNIINNAKYAMSGGGVFTVRTQVIANSRENGVQANGDSPLSSERHLRIEFTDTGTGIKKEHLGKIFDPFFTTKPEDKGTGLGLSVSYSIIEKHGGTLEVESDGKTGTTFIIELPLNQEEVELTS